MKIKNYNSDRKIINKGVFYVFELDDRPEYYHIVLALETTCDLTKETVECVIINYPYSKYRIGDIEKYNIKSLKELQNEKP